jgi:short-subunit dehydrogenase
LPATGPLDDFTVEEIDRALDVNLRAPILLARAAAPSMVNRGGGHIVFVSSLAAKLPGPALGLYAATKQALRGLGLALHEDLRSLGVGVSVIYPGPISDVGMWADAHLRTPFGMPTRPPDAVADAVVRAVTTNRAEIAVASRPVQAAAAFAHVCPRWFAALARRPSKRYAVNLTAAGKAKR